ncbi:right-handed parallel beta-helix repeat-containing protein [Marinicaulis aureus]|uniref:Right-handed parallel beta-helix repeat-containing protein n=1 Tax=Hyphococcus aureus TaxID=2666033 RepID=A0ABW1L2E2_9PROT
MANTTERFSQSFETDSQGFLDETNGWSGVTTEVPSGTGGVVSPDGSSHSIFEQSDDAGGLTGPFTRFDSYRALSADQGFTTSVKIYLDPTAWAAGEGFDYSVAANNQSGGHLRDFIFHVTQDTSTGDMLIGASNNSNFNPVENLEAGNHAVVATADWYTFEHTFYDAGDDTLAVSLTVKNSAGITIYAEVLNDPGDSYSGDFGGNRYGWFTNIDVAGGIAVDDAKLLVEYDNAVEVREDGVIVATYATIDAAKTALDNGDFAVTSAEISTFGADDSFFYVAEGMSIQAAVDAASDGDDIQVAAGIFNESVDVNKEVAITGAGSGLTILEGTLLTDLSVPGGTPLNDFFEANHPSYAASLGVEVNADNVSISGFSITGFSVGMAINTSDGVAITDNTFIDNATGLINGTAGGFAGYAAQTITNLTVSDNTFSQGVRGIVISAHADGSFDGVVMDDNSFSALSEKGLYFEHLSNATLTGNMFDDVGNYGRISPPFGGTDGEFGQAIELNYKFLEYTNVVFADTIITNSGYSNQDGVGSIGAFGAAVNVKLRDDAPSYSGDPATFLGSVQFIGGSIDGTSTGIRIGEPGKNNLGPNVLINGVMIDNASVSDIENATDAASGGLATVIMDQGQTMLDGSASQASLDITGTNLDNDIFGGSGNDVVLGLGGPDLIEGRSGDDILYGNTGNDRLEGGDGNDSLFGGDGNDVLRGDADDDLLIGGDGDDTLTGETGNDDIRGSAGNDLMRGGDGADSLEGGSGVDLIYGDNGDDYIDGGSENDDLRGSAGNDTILGGFGRDVIRGNSGDDDIRGGAGGDTLAGGLDNDELRGASGDDAMKGEAGDDYLSAGIDDDLVKGNEGADTLIGGDGNDSLQGNPGDDLLYGQAGDDDLRGGNDNDTLDGGAGNDTLRGNSGDDVFVYTPGADDDLIIGFEGGAGVGDVIDLSVYDGIFDDFADVQAAASEVGASTVIDLGGGDSITLHNIALADLDGDDFLF